jgi:hypothetical protein
MESLIEMDKKLKKSQSKIQIQGDSEISLEKNPVIGDDEKLYTKKKILIKVFSFSRYK